MFWHIAIMDVYRHRCGYRLTNYRDHFCSPLSPRICGTGICPYRAAGKSEPMKRRRAIVMPIFSRSIPVNMNTLKLEVQPCYRRQPDHQDRMRVDVVVAFFVRVNPLLKVFACRANMASERCRRKDLRMLVEDKIR